MEYIFEYNGPILSTNEVKSKHWKTLKKKVDALKLVFKKMILDSNLPDLDQIEVQVEYWSRHDVDNVTSSVKFFVDQLVKNKKLPEDNKKHWRKLTIEVNKKLKINTLKIKIISLG